MMYGIHIPYIENWILPENNIKVSLNKLKYGTVSYEENQVTKF